MKVKIISLFRDENLLIRKAVAEDREAQKALYELYAPKMLAVCNQYVKDLHFAEDVMIEGFVVAFRNLGSYEFRGSFEGWIRKIMVRKAIDFLRKRQFVVFDETYLQDEPSNYKDSDTIELNWLEKLIEALPEGYRMVFTLRVVEGYKHAEIAELLGISENTSKTQFFKARKQLLGQMEKQEIRYYGTRSV